MDDDYDYECEARRDARDGWEFDGHEFGDDTREMLWYMLDGWNGECYHPDAYLWFEDWVMENYPVLDTMQTMRDNDLTAEQMLESMKKDFVDEHENDREMLENMGATKYRTKHLAQGGTGMAEDCYKDVERASENDVREIFTEGSKVLGYTGVQVNIRPMEDLRIRWMRYPPLVDGIGGYVNWTVSDYLLDAPRDVVMDIARCIMLRVLMGEGGELTEFGIDTKMYLSSDEFAERHQTEYIQRRGLTQHGLTMKFREYLAEAQKSGYDVPKCVKVVYADKDTLSGSRTMRVIEVPKRIKEMNLSKEALWTLFDNGMVRIAKGLKDCKVAGAPPETAVFGRCFVACNLTQEDMEAVEELIGEKGRE